MKPLILLDVDGVLNAVCSGKTPDNEFGDFQEARVGLFGGLIITYSPEMGRRLAALDADIHWLTTWKTWANEHIAPLFAWAPFPVVPDIDPMEKRGWWKASGARAVLEADPRPFVWIDDDLYYSVQDDPSIMDWIDALKVPRLLLTPSTERGILPAQMEMVEEFVEKHG